MRGGTGATLTPISSHLAHARFSRFVTSTKYLAGFTLIRSLVSMPCLGFSALEIDAAQQHRELRSGQPHGSLGSLRPWASCLLETEAATPLVTPA